MKKIEISLLILSVLFTVSAYAERMAPKKVEPVSKDDIRYEAPNKPSRIVMVEAWDENSGKKLWEQIVYEVKDDPKVKVEEDCMWDFITLLTLDGDMLLITTEHRQYRMDVKTRKVERIDKDKPAKDTVADPIDILVQQLNASNGLWINGMYPIITLPSDAKPDEVLAQAVKMTGFDQGHIKTYQIHEIRQVQLENTGWTGIYSAALLQSDLGTKIFLFKPEENNHWWTRFYDVPNEKPNKELKTDVSAIAWGPEVDGLQIGLMPIGRGADGKLAWRSECPDCAVAVERRLWSGTCDICGAKADQGAHCESCRTNLRLCDRCKKVRPDGACFNAGEALSFEVHIRNTGKKDVVITDLDSNAWELSFMPKDGKNIEDGWHTELEPLKNVKGGIFTPPILVPPGGYRMRFWVVGPGGSPAASFVSARCKEKISVASLPVGEYMTTVVLLKGSGNELRGVTSGPATIQIGEALFPRTLNRIP